MKATVSDESPAVTEVIAGAEAPVTTFTVTASEPAPAPAAFTARTFSEYCVPTVRPLISNDVLETPADTAGANAAQVVPPSLEYSKLVIADPPLEIGLSTTA